MTPTSSPVPTASSRFQIRTRALIEACRSSICSCAGRSAEAPRIPSVAIPSPSAAPASTRSVVSVSRCLAIRQRFAPSARRTASSRCRVVERARKRLARLAQAMSSTSATAPSSRNAAGRMSASSAAAHGVAVSDQPSYSRKALRLAASVRAARAASSAFAAASDAPGRRRPTTVNWRTFLGTAVRFPPHGIQRSVPISRSPGGITPTTVVD